MSWRDAQGHPIFVDAVFQAPDAPALKHITNGARTLLVLTRRGLSRGGSSATREAKVEFPLGANLFIYAAGKRELRNRLETPYRRAARRRRSPTVKVGRADTPGNWDPSGRLGPDVKLVPTADRHQARPTTVKLADVSSLKPSEVRSCHLRAPPSNSSAPATSPAVKAYVEGGGVLFGRLDRGSATL